MGEVSLPLTRHPADGVATRALAVLPDDRLARLAAEGNTAAFATIYRRHHQALYRYCRSILHDGQDAEDALQNTMVSVLRALPGEERKVTLRPWLFRVAHNEAISLLRRRSPDAPIDVASTLASQHNDPAARERLRALIADLAALPDRQRSALVMRELNGLSYAEVGVALNTSEAAAKQLVYEARTTLHEVEEGREMSCDAARATISARDRRKLRGRKLRAHLRSCRDCRAFEASIARRRADFAELAPPLSAPAAAAVLQSVLGGGGGSGGGIAGLAAGAAGKWLGGSAAIKAASVVAAGVGLGAGAVVSGSDLLPEALDRKQVAVAPAQDAGDARVRSDPSGGNDGGGGGAAAKPGESGTPGYDRPGGNGGSGPGSAGPSAPAPVKPAAPPPVGTAGTTVPDSSGGLVGEVDDAIGGSVGVNPGVGQATAPVTDPVDDILQGNLPDVGAGLPDVGSGNSGN